MKTSYWDKITFPLHYSHSNMHIHGLDMKGVYDINLSA